MIPPHKRTEETDTINGVGGFLMKAERVGRETMLARIVALLGEAQRSRAPIQALAGRIAGVFVPAVERHSEHPKSRRAERAGYEQAILCSCRIASPLSASRCSCCFR
jgi:hypothetical protein